MLVDAFILRMISGGRHASRPRKSIQCTAQHLQCTSADTRMSRMRGVRDPPHLLL